jgi:hypothetical protein
VLPDSAASQCRLLLPGAALIARRPRYRVPCGHSTAPRIARGAHSLAGRSGAWGHPSRCGGNRGGAHPSPLHQRWYWSRFVSESSGISPQAEPRRPGLVGAEGASPSPVHGSSGRSGLIDRPLGGAGGSRNAENRLILSLSPYDGWGLLTAGQSEGAAGRFDHGILLRGYGRLAGGRASAVQETGGAEGQPGRLGQHVRSASGAHRRRRGGTDNRREER